ncbi:MAG: hypothetical protein A2W99_07040 [Bacteroidetes bacterium GWF2_33_16]|nr:MAG: hypothetical protein A2X00_12300 [Bacteroidetes bacterium GWE2_32_14]OFY08324.1 MAG: hypothetical protein A2W99_07040 [Bacteroidetes bacterium GWF2_33_16]
MNVLKYFLVLIFIFSFYSLKAQNRNYEFLFNKNDTLIKDCKFFAGLQHQHQDFFNKAFSFQGIEVGAILNHNFVIGVFGATFVSNLNVELANNPIYVNIWKTGFNVGQINNRLKVLHTGWMVNVGYFSLVYDDINFKLFNSTNSSIRIEGLILSPELYAELNVSKWMKLRTGLAYSFYSFESQTLVKTKDLQNISLNFGFIFGRFK